MAALLDVKRTTYANWEKIAKADFSTVQAIAKIPGGTDPGNNATF